MAALFGENGYTATSMDDIAKRAGVNKATIYYHIGKKKDLFQQIHLQPLDEIQTSLVYLQCA